MRMQLSQGKVAKGESNGILHPLQNRSDDRVGHAAVGTLVIAIFNQGHRGISRSQGVVPVAQRRDQLCAHEGAPMWLAGDGIASSAARTPSAPGLTSTGER